MSEEILKRRKILIVDDEERMIRFIRLNLEHDGFIVAEAFNGKQALQRLRDSTPDLILLDVMMPDLDGFEVLEMIREITNVPVIMLTAKGEEEDRVHGLEKGADDYITKPFSTKILLARIRTVLRRKHPDHDDNGSIIQIRELVINPQRHEVLVSGKKVELTSTEFRLLHFLTRRPGWVFTRAQLVEAAHGINYPVTDRSIDFQIVGLRKKLGPLGKYIETIRGVGYRFQEGSNLKQ